MSGGAQKGGRAALVRALYEKPEAAALLKSAAPPMPEPLVQWLARLQLLEGLPFNALVADERMLPRESIRFFFTDPNWLDALQDGALSVAAGFDGHHAATLAMFRDEARALVRAAALAARRRRLAARRGKASPPARNVAGGDDTGIGSGFLLRSAAVSDWPNLNVQAFADREAQVGVPLLRAARLSPTVLLAMFAGVARRFDVGVPQQSLRFGVEARDGGLGIALRGLGGAHPSGKVITGQFVPAQFRAAAPGVLDIAKMRAAIEEKLRQAYAGEAPPLHSGAFAIEMVAGSQTQSFYNGAPLPEAAHGR